MVMIELLTILKRLVMFGEIGMIEWIGTKEKVSLIDFLRMKKCFVEF